MRPLLSPGIALGAFMAFWHIGVTAQYSTGWNFTWPNTTQQCSNVTISISGGSPPWVAGLIPIGKAPITWRINAPPDVNNISLDNPVTATIPVQLAAGTLYTVMVTDQIGYAGGGVDVLNPVGIQRVGESTDASCLAEVNYVPQEFTFAAFGSAEACEDNFKLSWYDQVGRSPYSMTVVPLDTSYHPWDVDLSGGVVQPEYDWTVNMTAGTRFTLIMTNTNGWGRGGVGQIYQVANGSDSCVTQANLGKVIMPAIATAPPLPGSAAFTTTISPASAGQTGGTTTNQEAATTTADDAMTTDNPKETGGYEGNGNGNGNGNGSGNANSGQGESKSSVAAIAGGVGGGVGALLIVGLLAWLLLRRRKRTTVDRDGYQYSPPIDYAGGPNAAVGTGTHVDKVEPFTGGDVQNQANAPDMAYAPSSSGRATSQVMSPDMPYAPYDNRASMAFPVPAPLNAGPRDSYFASSQTADSSDGQGYDYASSSGAGASAGAAGVVGGSAGHENPYAALKTAAPPTFTSPRHSVPTLGPAVAGSSASGPSLASAGHGLDSPSSPPAGADNRASYISPQTHSPPIPQQGEAGTDAGHPHQEFNFVRHSDGGAMPPAQAQPAGQAPETIELPPEYDDRRASVQ